MVDNRGIDLLISVLVVFVREVLALVVRWLKQKYGVPDDPEPPARL
jgi:hypothetical protein